MSTRYVVTLAAAALLCTTLSAAPIQTSTPLSHSLPHARLAPMNLGLGMSMTGASYNRSGSTVQLHADRIDDTIGAGGPTFTSKLELWACIGPPVAGQTIYFYPLAESPLGTIAPGQMLQNVNSGSVTYTAPPDGVYYIAMALSVFNSADSTWYYMDLYTFSGITRTGVYFSALTMPQGMFEVTSSTANDSFILVNNGDQTESVILQQTGTFFTASPLSFSLAPGLTQTISITAATKPSGVYEGSLVPVVSGTALALTIPVKLFVASQPSGSVIGAPQTNRIDVSAPRGNSTVNGSATFVNSGTSTLNGYLMSDVPCIIPQSGQITIPAGGSQVVTFTIDRTQRSDAGMTGSVSGSLFLIYVSGAGVNRNAAGTIPPGTSLAGVIVSDTAQPPVTSLTVPALTTGEVALLIPGVGHVTGGGGREYVSDISVVNSLTSLPVGDMKMFYITGGTSLSASPVLAPNQSLSLADVVTSTFGQQSQGTLQIRSSSSTFLSVSANVFNKSDPKGTFGTALPIFRTDRAAAPGETIVLTGLRKDLTAHTNIYLQEMSGGTATAHIDFYDANGSLVLPGYDSQQIGPFALGAAGSIVPPNAVSARVRNTSGAKLAAYATPGDEQSGDTWAVVDWNRQYGAVGNEGFLIPVVGAAAGANNTYFQTDAAITEAVGGSASVTLTYVSSGISIPKTINNLGPYKTAVYTDIINTLFQAGSGIGAVIVRPTSGKIEVTSRTYTTDQSKPASGSYGTGVPTVPLTYALRSGQSRVFGGLEDSTKTTANAKRPATFRTNFSLVETTGQSATVRVTVFFPDGHQLAAGGSSGSMTVDLTGFQFVQYPGLLASVLGASRETSLGDVRNVQVKFEVISGSGSVLPFVTEADNGTSDSLLRTE
jgi:hypothetical protein